MGFRIQKRIRIAPGIKVNLTASKRGLTTGMTGGVKGASMTVNSRGRKTTTVGLPGTGISHVSTKQFGPVAQSGGSNMVVMGILAVVFLIVFIGVCVVIAT